MKKQILSNRMKKIFGGMVMAAIIAAISIPVYAMEDGAYTVGRTTSYANPETGATVDGGTNIALGDSMCASIVEGTALVEQYQGKTYVTLGLGLMSNVSNVRIQIQGSDGNYREVAITQTGSCSRDGDTCNHYRFEVDSAENYISPILYVTPMGRDVQFFVKLDMSSATVGTGNFVSEMIPAATETAESTTTTQESEASTTTQADTTTVPETSAESSGAQDTVEQETSVENVSGQLEEVIETQETTETEEATEELIPEETEEATERLEEATEELMTEDTEVLEEKETNKKESKNVVAILITVIVVIAAAGGIGYGIYRKKRM